MVLNSDYRITKQKLLRLAQLIEADRLDQLKDSPELIDCDPPQDIEEKDFWIAGDINIIQAILVNNYCNCIEPGKHLLSPDPCPSFTQRMKALDYFYSRIVIRRMIQNNGDNEFFG